MKRDSKYSPDSMWTKLKAFFTSLVMCLGHIPELQQDMGKGQALYLGSNKEKV